MKVIWSPLALEKLEEIAKYIALDKSNLSSLAKPTGKKGKLQFQKMRGSL